MTEGKEKKMFENFGKLLTNSQKTRIGYPLTTGEQLQQAEAGRQEYWSNFLQERQNDLNNHNADIAASFSTNQKDTILVGHATYNFQMGLRS